MSKFNVHEPLLPAPDIQSVTLGLQIMEQVRGFMNNNVAIRVFRAVGRPPHMGEFSSRHTIAFRLDFVRLESMILKVNPQNLPSCTHVAGRQFCLNGRLGPLKGQYEGPSTELAEGYIVPIGLHKPLPLNEG